MKGAISPATSLPTYPLTLLTLNPFDALSGRQVSRYNDSSLNDL